MAAFVRTDPETVEAWQYTGGGELPADMPEWPRKWINVRPIPNDGLYWFDSGGNQRVYPGGWIVWGEGGFTAWSEEQFSDSFAPVKGDG